MPQASWVILNMGDSVAVEMLNKQSFEFNLKPEEHLDLEVLPLDSFEPILENEGHETKSNVEEEQIEVTLLSDDDLQLNEMNVDTNVAENKGQETHNNSKDDAIEVLAREGRNISAK